jgi:chemotaxis receptor (MCP) glutamine deamidase CheD
MIEIEDESKIAGGMQHTLLVTRKLPSIDIIASIW